VDYTPELNDRAVQSLIEISRLSWPSFSAAVEQMHRFNPRRSLDNIAARLTHSLRRFDDGLWRFKVDPAFIEQFQKNTESIWEAAKNIRCPVLIVRGEQSDITNVASVNQLHAALINSSICTIKGAGHSVAGDNPLEFAQQVISFLKACVTL
jgi:pimeloyl-ACP methyl ester carboxylesterase